MRLGPYEIVAPIGAGGMGEVYRARDTRLGRSVAIKVLPSDFAGDERLRVRFEREAKAISALNHPHICTLHDVGRESGIEYLVLEHCEGETLARRLDDGPLPNDQLLNYAMQIADALDKAHRQGIVHRDLKPSNIMITKSGVKVLDFGLAKRRADHPPDPGPDHSTVQRLSEDGALIGTVQYMAPEVLAGKEADARSDIFGLGLVMYEMATGQRAFSATSKPGLIAAILARDPKPLAELRPGIAPALARVINACLAKDPDERMQSAHDVQLELKWSAEGSIAPQARRPRLRTAVVMGVLAVVALAAVIAIVIMRKPDEKPAGVRRLAITLPADAPVASEPVMGNLFAISPDGRRLVYVGAQGLHVRKLDQLTADLIPGTEGAMAPFFSPDGNWVGFSSGDKLKKVPLAGGNPLTICDGVRPRGAFWGPDDIIVCAQLSGPLVRIRAAGGTPQSVTPVIRELRFPHPLPGGRELLVTVSDVSGDPNRYDVALLTLADGKLRTIVPGAIHGRYATTGHLFYFRSGSVYRARFDIESKKIVGEAQPILDDVATSRPQGIAYVEVSGKTLYYIPRDPAIDQRELVWADRGGRLTPAAQRRRGYSLGSAGPRLSSDGKQIVTDICAREECDVWRYEIERATWSRVTSDGHSYAPLWSPDGRSIVYTCNRNGPYNLFTVPSDRSSEPRQLTNRKSWPFPNSWSPDGKLIAVSESQPATGADISFIPVDGKSEAIPYLATAAQEMDPAFSPDGRWVAYRSSQSGNAEVYIRAANGEGPTWQVSDSGGKSPRWRDDGKELFFRRDKAMMAVDVRTSSTVFIAKPHLLFEGDFGEGFDVTSDGQRFLMTRAPQPAARRQINVVEGLLD